MSDFVMGLYTPGLVSIIIPAMHRSKTDSIKRMLKPLYRLEDCVRDIAANVKTPYELIVVCNETKKREFIEFVTGCPHIHRHCLMSENAGVPRAWNMGACMAVGEHLLFVNDDVEIGPGAVEGLLKHMQDNPGIGMIGPEGSMWHRREPGPRVGLDKPENADAVAGWLFMTPRKVFDEVGGFDAAYTPALCEEIDYAFAVRSRGYLCRVVPGLAFAHHHVSGASSTNKPITALGMSLKREELTERNRRYFEAKWSQFWEDGGEE